MNRYEEYRRVVRRQYLEKNELYAHIHSMKNSIPKNDKDRRKQMFLDASRLETQMKQRHQQELERLRRRLHICPEESVRARLSKINLENVHPRSAKAQRRRQRRAALQEHHKRAVRNNTRLNICRRKEEEKVASILRPKNMVMKTIPADGHCLYRAIQDQLPFSVTVETLRCHTAYYMLEHIDEFLPFFNELESDDIYTRKDFQSYCDDIIFQSSWGGHLELTAMSHILQTPIEVIQANGPSIVIGKEYYRKPLTIVYLHFACNLADHYNSVRLIESSSVRVGGLGPPPRLF